MVHGTENAYLANSKQKPFFSSKDLALLWRIPFSSETEPSRVEVALRERIKELNCLYGVTQLAERNMNSIDRLLQELVTFVPYAWQYPEITSSRILYRDKTYKSENFEVTGWRQSSLIYMYHEPVGEICICYLEERPPAFEGPFLREERVLLDALADQIGTIASRISAELELQETNRQLMLERKALQESNTTLRSVLANIEGEKQEIHRDIKTNVDKVLVPVLNALALQLPPLQQKYVEMLRVSLDEITSSFINKLSQSYHSLSPTEITIYNMVRNGMRNKEIADIRGVAEATINRHREKIRRKLKITNQDVNLATYLQSNMWDGGKSPPLPQS